MAVKIVNNVVHGGPAYKVPGHLNFAQYIIDKLRHHASNPQNIAFINGETDEPTTCKQLLQRIVNIATGLKKLGIKRGDIVAICGERSIEYIVFMIATMCCGATVTVFSEHNTSSEMDHALNISRPNILICSKSVLDNHNSTFKTLVYVKHIVQINENPLDKNIRSYNELDIPSNVHEFEVTDVEGSTDGLLLLYSSGTTGLPKGVILTHLSILYAAATLDNENEENSYNRNLTSILTVVPWYHAYGLIVTLFAIVINTPNIFYSSFNIEKYLNAIQKYKPRSLVIVPSIVTSLAKSTIINNYDVSSVTALISSSAQLSPSTVKEAVARFPNCLGVFDGYGMTEIMSPTKNIELLSTKPNTIGYPVPGVKMKVVDMQTEKKLGPNQNGEIRIKGPLLMKGYANNEKATKETIDEEGYMKTGDIGYYDVDGYFFIIDRMKNLIKYKGYQVSPAEVESVLLQHPMVEECGVVGTPDEKAGELPTAFVVIKKGMKLAEEQLLLFSMEKLSHYKRIRGGIIFVDEIPKTKTGKILHNELKKMVKQKGKSKL